jgi:integrase
MTSRYRKATRHPGIIEVGPNRFQLFIPLGRDPITGQHKAHRPVFSGTLSEARARRTDLMAESKQRNFTTSGWTVGKLVEEFFKQADTELAWRTLKGYRDQWRVLKPALENRPVHGITEYEIDRLLSALQKSRGLKGQTINRYKSFLSSVFGQAKQWKLIRVNPIKDVATRKEQQFKVDLPTQQLLEWVLDAHEQYGRHGLELSNALQVGWLNQLRENEICGLKVGDFDPEGNSLMVVRQPIWTASKTWMDTPLKNRQERKVWPLDEASVRSLKLLIDGRTDPDAYILSDDGGVTPWRADRISKAHARVRSRVCKQCGFYGKSKTKICPDCNIELGSYFRVQDLRAWTTTFLIARGHSKLAQQRGGWQSEIVMRTNYNHFTVDGAEKATEEINSLLRR